MKKVLTILITIFLLITAINPLKAQESTNPTQDDNYTQTTNQITESETVNTNPTEQVELPKKVEESPHSITTILLAILIPCILLLIAYLIFKFTKF